MGKRIIGGTILTVVGLALAGCSSSTTTSTTTSTAAKSATTTTSGSSTSNASEGAASPQDLGTAYLAVLSSPDPGSFCTFAVPSQVANCKTAFTTPAGQAAPTFKGMAVGSVDIQGSKAIVNLTGTTCMGAQCISNTDPKVGTADGTSFDEAFSTADNPNSPNSTPFVVAAVMQNGRWYASGF
ncbi:MAG TPA: hypothetical protein VII96_06240 [Acidimicrobiales bacterium]